MRHFLIAGLALQEIAHRPELAFPELAACLSTVDLQSLRTSLRGASCLKSGVDSRRSAPGRPAYFAAGRLPPQRPPGPQFVARRPWCSPRQNAAIADSITNALVRQRPANEAFSHPAGGDVFAGGDEPDGPCQRCWQRCRLP